MDEEMKTPHYKDYENMGLEELMAWDDFAYNCLDNVTADLRLAHIDINSPKQPQSIVDANTNLNHGLHYLGALIHAYRTLKRVNDQTARLSLEMEERITYLEQQMLDLDNKRQTAEQEARQARNLAEDFAIQAGKEKVHRILAELRAGNRTN